MPIAPAPAIRMLPGSESLRICSSYVTTRSLSWVPGSSRVVAPAATMQCWKVIVRALPSFASTCRVCASVNSPHPSISSMPFFFIRKCTPLTRPSATLRLRLYADS